MIIARGADPVCGQDDVPLPGRGDRADTVESQRCGAFPVTAGAMFSRPTCRASISIASRELDELSRRFRAAQDSDFRRRDPMDRDVARGEPQRLPVEVQIIDPGPDAVLVMTGLIARH